jgi:hypothetical protein
MAIVVGTRPANATAPNRTTFYAIRHISSDVAGTKSSMSFCYSAIPPPSIDPSTCQNHGPAVDTATADDQVEEKC